MIKYKRNKRNVNNRQQNNMVQLSSSRDTIISILACLIFYFHYRVKSLFSWIPDDMAEPLPSLFSFKSVIENPKMKVSAILYL